ncbi:MAG TPA: ATP-binding protein [Ktedonobacteraceae bacterium]|jgi:two-component system phosphate regulon sensor histidine kinase PhoR|nr:ATP-binding protein [Ktedonobacteraceae bacterium]
MRKRTRLHGGTIEEVVDETALQDDTPASGDEAAALKEQTSKAGARGYLESLFTNSANPIIVLNARYQVVDCNPSAYEKLALDPDTTLGLPCNQVLRCSNLNGVPLCGTSSCPCTRVMEYNQQVTNEEVVLGAQPDQAVEYAVSVTPVEVEEGRGAVFVGRDISAIKVANSVRSNFVSMVSHELRTPLNSVHGFIDLLMQGHMGELNAEQKLYLGYAQEGVQQLMSIVEDILFMTRSDSGQFELKKQKVNAHVLTRQVLNGLKPQALKASVELIRDVPTPAPLLYADPQRMKQVLNNLVTNAIKYTPPGGTVTIRCRPYNEHFVMISVEDTGYGIPPEDQPHVFERFYQSNHHLQSKMGGYGLGLAIAKLIVEQHGGVINLDSQLNKGTTFYFTAPLYTGQEEE